MALSFKRSKRNLQQPSRKPSRGDDSLPVDFWSVVNMAVQRRIEQSMDRTPWYIIDPRGARMARWDVATSAALSFTAIVTPFEVGLLGPPSFNALFVLNRLVDVIFVTDLCVHFFLMRRKQYTKSEEVRRDFGFTWETDLRKLARSYLRGWFLPDLLSVAPCIFDVVQLAATSSSEIPGGRTSCGEIPGGLSSVRTLRLLRLFRLLKVTRLVRGLRVLKRIERRNAVPYAKLSFVLILLEVFLAVHWIACGITIAPALMVDSKLDSWLATYGLCRPDGHDECGERKEVCVDYFEIHLQALYWAFGMVTGFVSVPSGGPFPPHYSDYSGWTLPPNTTEPSIAPLRPGEQTTCMALALCGAALWAYVTARLVELIINADPDETSFRAQVDALNRYCDFHQLPASQVFKLRDYYHEKREAMREESHSQVTKLLSPRLAEDAAWHVHRNWLVTLPLMGEVNKAFLSRVALKMEHTVYAPRERPPLGSLYCIFQGVARFNHRTLGPGDCFGERDVLLASSEMRTIMRARHTAFSVTYLHCHYISKATLESMRDEFPRGVWTMRKYVIKQAILEWVRHYYLTLRARAHAIFREHASDGATEMPLQTALALQQRYKARAALRLDGRHSRARDELSVTRHGPTLHRHDFVSWWVFGRLGWASEARGSTTSPCDASSACAAPCDSARLMERAGASQSRANGPARSSTTHARFDLERAVPLPPGAAGSQAGTVIRRMQRISQPSGRISACGEGAVVV